ncbi:MAG: MarR family transcriptional regulator [Myxococcota bacterium]
MVSPPEEFTHLFGQLYMHLHPRQEKGAFRPSRESMGVLRHLAMSGPLTVKEASLHFHRSQSAMSEMVERLMARGLLARKVDPEDRRRHLVWLTEEGRRTVVQHSQPLSEALVQRAFEQLSTEEREELLRTMRRLHEVVADIARNERKKP